MRLVSFRRTATKLLVGLCFLLPMLFLDCHRTEGEIPIGVVLPLTGSMAEYGENGREGLTLAREEMGKQPDLKRVRLIFQDTKDLPQETVDAVRRLIDVHKVRFIIGGLTSSGVLAAAPYAQSHGVLFFSPAASAPGIPQIGDLVFRNWPSADLIAGQFGRLAFQKLGIRKIVALNVSNDYGRVNFESFRASFQAAGGSVLDSHSFPQGNTDFKTLVTQVRTTGFDRILLIAYPDEYRAFFQEAASGTWTRGKVLASDTFFSPRLASELGSPADETICAVADKPGENYKPRQDFIASYRARFRTPDGKPKEPGLVSDTAYDAMKLVTSAISKTDGSPQAASRWLLTQIRNYQGAAGPTTFTKDGDVTGDIAMYRLTNSKFEKLGE